MGLQKRTQFCILRRSASINNKYLPPKTEYIVFCRPQPLQISLYLEFCSSVVSHAIQSTSPSAKVLLAICMLRKLCNHPKFVDNTFSEATDTGLTSGFVESLVDIDGKEGRQKQPLQYRFEPAENGLSGKLQCLDSLLSAVFNPSSNTMDRVVIVSNFTQCLDMIQGLCDHRCWKWLRLDGTTDTSSRQQLVDHFNKGFGDELIFLLSSKAGGTGLNLIGANRLVLFDPDWNPAIDAQAMARIWREGQPKPVIIYRLLTTGSIEEKIYQRQVMKGEFAATIEGHGEARFLSKKGGQHFSREELQELFTLRLGLEHLRDYLRAGTWSRQAREILGDGPPLFLKSVEDPPLYIINSMSLAAKQADFISIRASASQGKVRYTYSRVREANIPIL